MGQLFDNIRRSVQKNRYVFSDHADNMLRERGIMHWHIVEGIDQAHLLSERPNTRPNPTIEVEQILPDGTPFKAVWCYVRSLDLAKVVTIHFFTR